ncbi:MAG: group 1 truncated hemoglobin [Chloroflexi bacterium]|nr:group 1 truncated hemoglobin [Chloroflexota bacterium]PWB48867.1 MAG: group 1 truncated hemoglobin [Dehalococcoidia bacterium]
MTQTMTRTLYDRLGGGAGLRKIANDLVDAHLQNPTIAPRFGKSDPDTVKRLAYEFFAAGSGGTETYTGRDLRTIHGGMNVSEEEFVTTVDDVMKVLLANGVGQREQEEVLAIFWALKGDVLRI